MILLINQKFSKNIFKKKIYCDKLISYFILQKSPINLIIIGI